MQIVLSIQSRQFYLRNEQCKREPLSTEAFYRALDRVPRYLDYLKTLMIKWIGLIFYFPILWVDPREEDDSGYDEEIIEFLGFGRIEEQRKEAKD